MELDARARMMESGSIAVATACSILLAHYSAVLPHEFAHSFMAFTLGLKSQPLAIHIGSSSLVNILLLSNIDEHVDYDTIFAQGSGPAAAVIGLPGPLANGALYLVSLILMRLPRVRASTLLFMLAYCFSFMNAANLYDYIPIRTFTSHADIGSGWHLSSSALQRLRLCGICSCAPCRWNLPASLQVQLAEKRSP